MEFERWLGLIFNFPYTNCIYACLPPDIVAEEENS
jgi:hypothetical protein